MPNDTPPMTPAELAALLNELLEAERAGAKLLSAYLDELPPDSPRRNTVVAVQRDEAQNCAVLMNLLKAQGAAASAGTGSFYERGLAIQDWRERLNFLNRGQGWVAKRIAAALPRLADSGAKTALREMHESHLANIRACEAL